VISSNKRILWRPRLSKRELDNLLPEIVRTKDLTSCYAALFDKRLSYRQQENLVSFLEKYPDRKKSLTIVATLATWSTPLAANLRMRLINEVIRRGNFIEASLLLSNRKLPVSAQMRAQLQKKAVIG
jgi:hypothetical protein